MTKPTYHALKELYAATRQGGGILPSPWQPDDAETVYQALAAFFPEGTPVTAVYASKTDLTTFRTFTGKVMYPSSISVDEPSFHLVDDRGFTILMPGSLLSVIEQPAPTA